MSTPMYREPYERRPSARGDADENITWDLLDPEVLAVVAEEVRAEVLIRAADESVTSDPGFGPKPWSAPAPLKAPAEPARSPLPEPSATKTFAAPPSAPAAVSGWRAPAFTAAPSDAYVPLEALAPVAPAFPAPVLPAPELRTVPVDEYVPVVQFEEYAPVTPPGPTEEPPTEEALPDPDARFLPPAAASAARSGFAAPTTFAAPAYADLEPDPEAYVAPAVSESEAASGHVGPSGGYLDPAPGRHPALADADPVGAGWYLEPAAEPDDQGPETGPAEMTETASAYLEPVPTAHEDVKRVWAPAGGGAAPAGYLQDEPFEDRQPWLLAAPIDVDPAELETAPAEPAETSMLHAFSGETVLAAADAPVEPSWPIGPVGAEDPASQDDEPLAYAPLDGALEDHPTLWDDLDDQSEQSPADTAEDWSDWIALTEDRPAAQRPRVDLDLEPWLSESDDSPEPTPALEAAPVVEAVPVVEAAPAPQRPQVDLDLEPWLSDIDDNHEPEPVSRPTPAPPRPQVDLDLEPWLSESDDEPAAGIVVSVEPPAAASRGDRRAERSEKQLLRQQAKLEHQQRTENAKRARELEREQAREAKAAARRAGRSSRTAKPAAADAGGGPDGRRARKDPYRPRFATAPGTVKTLVTLMWLMAALDLVVVIGAVGQYLSRVDLYPSFAQYVTADRFDMLVMLVGGSAAFSLTLLALGAVGLSRGRRAWWWVGMIGSIAALAGPLAPFALITAALLVRRATRDWIL